MDEYIAETVRSVCARYQIFPEYIESFCCLNLPIRMQIKFIDTFEHIYPLHPEFLMKMYKTIIFDTWRQVIFCPSTMNANTVLALKPKIPELCEVIDNGHHIIPIMNANTIDDLKIIYSGVSPSKNMISENMPITGGILFTGYDKIMWLFGTFKIPDTFLNVICTYYGLERYAN